MVMPADHTHLYMIHSYFVTTENIKSGEECDRRGDREVSQMLITIQTPTVIAL